MFSAFVFQNARLHLRKCLLRFLAGAESGSRDEHPHLRIKDRTGALANVHYKYPVRHLIPSGSFLEMFDAALVEVVLLLEYMNVIGHRNTPVIGVCHHCIHCFQDIDAILQNCRIRILKVVAEGDERGKGVGDAPGILAYCCALFRVGYQVG